jgi:minor histocompatibility antigen H13
MPVPTDIYCYGLIILLELTAAFVYIPVYTHMILLVSLILFIGCHNSLRGLSKTNPADQQEKMSTKDVYQFPIIGSCVLFGLYLIFKLLPKHYVMIVVKGYELHKRTII